MEKKYAINYFIYFAIIIMVTSTLFTPVTYCMASSDYLLPPPLTTDMILEESIMRRMSIREFTEEPVTDEELATVLWAAHGLREDGKRTIQKIEDDYSSIIYVLKEDAAYIYNPYNHSLVHFKDGDWRDDVGWQYEAPIQLGICWNTDIKDINSAASEIGQMCVNIYFMANALNLGTVACGQYNPNAIRPLGIPSNQDGFLVMPLGHPLYPYNFQYAPRLISPLPRVQYTDVTLSEVLEKIDITNIFTGELSNQQESQLLWASYGYSFYFDKSDNTIGRLDRHRTIPSAHGYYPNDIYFVKESGIYRYYPNFYNPIYGILYKMWFLPVIPFIVKIDSGDYRTTIAEAANNPEIANSPFIVIPVLDDAKAKKTYDDLSGDEWRWLWIFDGSSSANNILLEATAQGLYGNIFLPNNTDSIKTLLKLKDDQFPLMIIPLSDTI